MSRAAGHPPYPYNREGREWKEERKAEGNGRKGMEGGKGRKDMEGRK